VGADLLDALGIGGVLTGHLDRAAGLPEQEVVNGLVLIETHRRVAPMFERR
jgi:hypothetical protein